MRADNFRDDELPEVVRFLHSHGVKATVALNVLIFTEELPEAVVELERLAQTGVDAVILQDVGLVEIARRMFPTLRIHASTQMTITSPEGVRFAQELGIRQVVLARELSLRELEKFPEILPLEVFVHGALCVAYSGQCLTSEALGRRSANRGECAQACRMPYELIVDGAVRDLGDRRYLLSPKDLAAVKEIPDLIARGVVSFKIEGRLKSPEYVAAVTAVYRRALDAAMADRASGPTPDETYRLEMTFSRGLSTGWMHGVNHQELVGARFGKKRGAFVGRVAETARDHVSVKDFEVPVRPGDGVVFDTGGDTDREQGGRVYEVRGNQLFFEHGHIDFGKIPSDTRVWKTDDPALNRELRKSYAGKLCGRPDRREKLDFMVSGSARAPLVIECRGQAVTSRLALESARTRPLTTESLRFHLGKLGETAFELGDLTNRIEGEVLLPISELNRMRRELVSALPAAPVVAQVALESLLPAKSDDQRPPVLRVLCRSHDQLVATLEAGVREVMVDYEDIRRYREAVDTVREIDGARIFLATPRIQKAGEEGFFKLIENGAPDGVLIRNVGGISHFAKSRLSRIGDFSLNVANPVTAQVFHRMGLERMTISHDLNVAQIVALAKAVPSDWLELTLHHHMPMFHMEHCVFAAFLSEGTDHTNCGRPCDRHRVHLRDRVGISHPLRADVGCRNTLFHAVPQSGAGFYESFRTVGIRHFRIELLEESAEESRRIIRAYQDLLHGSIEGNSLWRDLKASSQVGVTSGTYE